MGRKYLFKVNHKHITMMSSHTVDYFLLFLIILEQVPTHCTGKTVW